MTKLLERLKEKTCDPATRSIESYRKPIIVLTYLVIGISACLIAMGLFTSVYMDLVDRSLWTDEASLAYPFTQRSFAELGRAPFENKQTAPLGWLYFVKTLTVLWGQTGVVIRIGSIVGFVLMLVFAFLLIKEMFGFRMGLIVCALLANMPYLLKYSNVFKPYIWDCACVLIVSYTYLLSLKKKLKLPFLTAIWMIVLWFSLACCFFEGGFILTEAFIVIWGRIKDHSWDRKKLIGLLVLFVGVILSFSVHYFHWLNANVGHMQSVWGPQDRAFPLLPQSKEDLVRMKELYLMLFQRMCKYTWFQYVMATLVILSLVLAIYKRDAILIGLHLSIAVALFASSIGMYPIKDRLWCFFFPVAVIVVTYELYSILICLSRHRVTEIIVFALLFSVICVHNGFAYLRDSSNVYWKYEEMNSEVSWIAEHIQHDEAVFVNHGNYKSFEFKNGYGKTSIAGYEGVVILSDYSYNTLAGLNPDDYDDTNAEQAIFGEDYQRLADYNGVYIPLMHYMEAEQRTFVQFFWKSGMGELVSYEYKSPLWFYYKDRDYSKMNAYLEVIDLKEYKGNYKASVRIHNEGLAYINHPFEQSILKDSNGNSYRLSRTIAPQEYYDFEVQWDLKDIPTFWIENNWGIECELQLAVQPLISAKVSTSATAGRIMLEWSALDGAEKYDLQRRAYDGTAWGEWADIDDTLAQTSYEDQTVEIGTEYEYRVRAYTDGWGAFSEGASAKVAPSPATVTATAAPGKITVEWSAVDGAEKYYLQRRVRDGSGWSQWMNLSIQTGTSYEDLKITAGTKYAYRVKSYMGGWGVPSAAATVSTAEEATASTSIKANVPAPATVTAAAANGKITVKWSAVDGAEKYQVQRRVYDGNTWSEWENRKSSLTETSYTDKSVVPGTEYEYRVKAYAGEWSAPSEAAAATAK